MPSARLASVAISCLVGSFLFAHPATAFPQQAPETRAVAQDFGRTTFEMQMLPELQRMTAHSRQRAMPMGPRPKDYMGLGINFPGFYTAQMTAATTASDQSLLKTAASGDFNGDGKPDVVTGQFDGTLNVLVNDGSGNLQYTSQDTSAQVFQGTVAYIAAADLNGDGVADVVGLDVENDAIVVWLNTGSGSFVAAKEFPVNAKSGATLESGSMAVADVNGDGKPDLVIVAAKTNGAGSTTLTTLFMPGNGDGTFGTAIEEDSMVAGDVFPYVGEALLLKDLNGDGHLDIVLEAVNDTAQTVTILSAKGSGDGSFAPLTLNGPSVKTNLETPSSIQVADVNGDGKPDAVFTVNDGNVYVCLGQGDTTFGPATIGLSGTLIGDIIKLADMNGDGIPDVIAFNPGTLSIYLGKGDGTFQPADIGTYAAGMTGLEEPDPADLNSDGLPDVVFIDESFEKALTYLNINKGELMGAPAVAPANHSIASNNIVVAASGDFNGDGISDVVVYDLTNAKVNHGADIDIGFGSTAGGFSFVTAIPGSQIAPLGIEAVVPVTGDFNGDGQADLILQASTNSLLIALSNGNGMVQTPIPVALPNAPACFLGNVDVGDVNGDGKLDIVATYGGDAVCNKGTAVPSGFYVMLGDGTGHFTTSFTAFGTQLYEPKLADWNGDGKLDLGLIDQYLGAQASDNTLAVYLLPGIGNGSFNTQNYATPSTNSFVSDILAGDYNGDGIADLTLLTEGTPDSGNNLDGSTAGVLLYPGTGNFQFGNSTLVAQQTFAIQGHYADFNADGKLDLIFSQYKNFQTAQNSYYGLVTLPNLGKGVFAPPLNEYLPQTQDDTGPEYTFVGDYNGDGAPDVVAGEFQPSILYLNRGVTTMKLTASPTTITFGNSIVITATLSSPLSSTSTGAVSFYVNNTLFDTEDISGNTAVLTTSTLPPGTDAITASYAGDDNHNPTNGAPITVVVMPLAASFSIAPTPASLTIARGQTGIVSLQLAANASFNGTIAVTCSGLPVGAMCTVNPASVTLKPGASATATLVIASSATGTSMAAMDGEGFWTLGGMSLACLMFFAVPRRRRLPRILMTVLCMLSLSLMAGVSGCGSSSNSGLPVGTYQVQVTATGESAGSMVTQMTTIHLTVTR